MQITVFHCVHKEIDNAFSPGANYLFRESGLQITSRLLTVPPRSTDPFIASFPRVLLATIPRYSRSMPFFLPRKICGQAPKLPRENLGNENDTVDFE